MIAAKRSLRGGLPGRRHQGRRDQGHGGGCRPAYWGRIDILHNNVGISLSGGDAELLDITEETLDRCIAISPQRLTPAARPMLPIMQGAEERRHHQRFPRWP